MTSNQSERAELIHRRALLLKSMTWAEQSGGDQRTPGRTSDPLQSTKCCACHAKANGRAAETKGRQGVHPTPCRAASAAPATQKAAETKGRQGVHPTPCRAPSAALATQKPPETKGRQGVHPTPFRAPSAAPATQNLPAKRRRPRDARAYIRSLAEQQVLRLPRKSYQQSGGDQGTPGRTSDPLQSSKCCACHAKSSGDQGTPGRTSDPSQSTMCSACHAKPIGRAAETKGCQGVHPTPCRASAAPATQKPPAERRRPRDARAYIRPLAEQQVPRLPRKSHRRPRDARAYIRPLAEHQVPRLPRKCHRQSGGDQGTPGGVHPTPCRAASAACACHAKSSGDQGTPGCTSDPLQSTKCPACRAKSHRRPRDARAYIRHLAEEIVPRLPRKSGRDEWVSEWGWVCEWMWVRVSVWVNVSEGEWVSEWEWVRVSEGEWVSVSEWMWVSECDWVRVSEEWVCVSECVWVWVWVWEWEWEWEWVSERASDWVSEWVWVSEWMSECEWVRVREWVSESEWVRVRVNECEWERREEDGRQRADTELKTKTPHVNDQCGE